MSVAKFGGFIIGGVMLVTGLAVIASNVDPLLLCFKRCEIPKAVVALFGPSVLRSFIGGFFVIVGLLFLLPQISSKARRGKPE